MIRPILVMLALWVGVVNADNVRLRRHRRVVQVDPTHRQSTSSTRRAEFLSQLWETDILPTVATQPESNTNGRHLGGGSKSKKGGKGKGGPPKKSGKGKGGSPPPPKKDHDMSMSMPDHLLFF